MSASSSDLLANQTSNGTYPVRPNPVRTQKSYNIDMCFEACTGFQTLTESSKLSESLTGCPEREV